jgi:pSer/pThr/pTyr-binding forkhead associated (FHA) protein
VSAAAMNAPAAQDRVCAQCGSTVPVNFRFCGACGFDLTAAAAAAPPRVVAAASEPAPQPKARATLTLIRPDGSEGGQHALESGENRLGRNHGVIFENDGYLSPEHAVITVHKTSAVIRDAGSLNGVFVRMTAEEEIQPGQVIRIGQELLRFDRIEGPSPLEDGTEVMGSPNPGFWGKITVIIGKETDGSAFPLLGEHVSLGRERGDINFPDDGYVSGLHARLSHKNGRVYLSDVGSSNGTFLRVREDRTIENGSFVLLGQQLFRIKIG